MEIRVLQYFLTVAREGNITKAAEVLHITQPTLSRQLAQLEEEVGVRLFVRGTRTITLTNEGILLRRRAEEIVSLVDKTAGELLEQEKQLAGNICFGCGELTAMQELTEIIVAFHKKYPLVTFDLFTGTADVVQERMERGLIDIGLMMEPINVDKFVFVRLSGLERWGVVMRADDPLARQDKVRAADLLDAPITFATRFRNSADLKSWFGDNYNKLQMVFTSNLPTNAALMVYNGLGRSLSVQGVKYFWDAAKLAFRPLDPPVEGHVALFWQKEQPLSLTVARFIEFAKCFLSMDTTRK